MFQRRIPEWLRHSPAPSVKGFATLAGIEAMSRAILISVFPLVVYRAYQDTATVSQIYFFVGVASMMFGLMVPWLTRFVPRRWMYSFGATLFILSAFFAIHGSATSIVLALLFYTIAVVTLFVCFNAYVLDYVAKIDLGKSETLRMFYSALAWTVGPAGGVWLLQWWPLAPFLLSAAGSAILLVVFWWMRLGNGKLITRARAPAPNPLNFIGRFFAQPRLIAGWLFAVIRSCGWWVYVVYLPIFAVENGLGENVGGTALSISNGLLFTTPLMLRYMQRYSIRFTIRMAFLLAGLIFVAATFSVGWPRLAVALLMLGTVFLVLLDICAGLPFLMAVKPSERTEMSAIYSTFRDVSGIITPGVAWLTLLVAPISVIFAVAGAGLILAWSIAGGLHPRLGTRRIMAIAVEPTALSADTPGHIHDSK